MNEVVSSEERGWAMAAHLCGLLWILGGGGLIFLPFGGLALFTILGPLIILLSKGQSMPFVAAQAKEALNFQITLLIGDVIGIATSCLVVGWFIIMAVWIVRLVFCIMAAIAVNRGEHYRYPFAIRLIK